MARLNMAKSRVRPAICSLVRIDQTCFGRRGGFAPTSLPLFHGSRREDCGMASMGSRIVGSSVAEGHQDVLVGYRGLKVNISLSIDLAAAAHSHRSSPRWRRSLMRANLLAERSSPDYAQGLAGVAQAIDRT